MNGGRPPGLLKRRRWAWFPIAKENTGFVTYSTYKSVRGTIVKMRILSMESVNQDRDVPPGTSPPTPAYIRITYAAVRPSKSM